MKDIETKMIFGDGAITLRIIEDNEQDLVSLMVADDEGDSYAYLDTQQIEVLIAQLNNYKAALNKEVKP